MTSYSPSYMFFFPFLPLFLFSLSRPSHCSLFPSCSLSFSSLSSPLSADQSVFYLALLSFPIFPARFLCALSSHSLAHFIRSRCTSKLHKSLTPCIFLLLFFSFSRSFLFIFLSSCSHRVSFSFSLQPS